MVRLRCVVGQGIYEKYEVRRPEFEAVKIGTPAALSVDDVGYHAVYLVATIDFGEFVSECGCDAAGRVFGLASLLRQENPIVRF